MERKIEDFKIIGVSVVTSNVNGKSQVDMGTLWQKFMGEGISAKINNKASDEVYVLYTAYESDFKGEYTAIIGHKVSSIEHIPDGLKGWQFEGGTYKKFTAKGQVPSSVVGVWNEIWSMDSTLNRRYTVDFEVYGLNSQKGPDSEVEVFIAVE